jgi:hypothetical protein
MEKKRWKKDNMTDRTVAEAYGERAWEGDVRVEEDDTRDLGPWI